MNTEKLPQPSRRKGMGFYPIMFFGFGIAAGILIAFSGIGYLEDGAIVFGDRFLAEMAPKAESETFRPDRFRVDLINRDDLLKLPIFVQNMTLEELDGIVGQSPIFRIKRVQPFDDGAPPVKTQQ